MEDTQILREEDAGWYDRAWTRRTSIKVNHKMVAGTEDLIDFPMFFDSQGFNLSGAERTGNDFLFTAGIVCCEQLVLSYSILDVDSTRRNRFVLNDLDRAWSHSRNSQRYRSILLFDINFYFK